MSHGHQHHHHAHMRRPYGPPRPPGQPQHHRILTLWVIAGVVACLRDATGDLQAGVLIVFLIFVGYVIYVRLSGRSADTKESSHEQAKGRRADQDPQPHGAGRVDALRRRHAPDPRDETPWWPFGGPPSGHR